MLRAVVESTLSQRPLLMAVYSRVYVVCAMFFLCYRLCYATMLIAHLGGIQSRLRG